MVACPLGTYSGPSSTSCNYTIPVSTLAGTVLGYADGQGTNAQFFLGLDGGGTLGGGIDVDASGNVYVYDNYNCAIRKITSTGAVTTLAGSALSSCLMLLRQLRLIVFLLP